MLNKDIIAYCGINCSECPAFTATQSGDSKKIEEVAKEWSNGSASYNPEDFYCDGCISKGRIYVWCRECDIRNCCLEKGFQNCAYCDDYFCDKLRITFEKVPAAKAKLDEIRESLG